MLSKASFLWWVMFGCCLVASCHSGDNHKNNNSRAKQDSAIVSPAQTSLSRTITSNISQDTTLSILSESLETTGLSGVLEKPGPFTLFAPLNAAFRKMPAGTLDGLLKERKEDMLNILSYHVVAGSLHGDFQDGQKLRTLAGEELVLTKRGERLSINGVTVVAPDIAASNGSIYIINGLLFPKSQNAGAY